MTHVTSDEAIAERTELQRVQESHVRRDGTSITWQTVAARPDFCRDGDGIFRRV